jgi:hypothetical protein
VIGRGLCRPVVVTVGPGLDPYRSSAADPQESLDDTPRPAEDTCLYERVAHNPTTRFSTDALKSAQIPVTAIDLGWRMEHEQGQNLPPLEPGADPAAATLTGGVAA